MPADKGVRLDDRQRIANFREQPIETNEYHSVDGAEGEFLWSSSPQNVDLLPQRPNLCLKHYPRPDPIDNHPTNEPAKIPHCTRSSSDSRSTAKQDKVCDRDSGELTRRAHRSHPFDGRLEFGDCLRQAIEISCCLPTDQSLSRLDERCCCGLSTF